MDQRYRAAASGCWPLIRCDPVVGADGGNPFLLDSARPRIALADHTNRELRYRVLLSTDPAAPGIAAGTGSHNGRLVGIPEDD